MPTIHTLLIGRLLMGAGASFAFTAAIYTATTIFSLRWQAFFIAMVTACGSFGFMLGTNLAQNIIELIGPAYGQAIMLGELSILLLVTGVLCYVYYRSIPTGYFISRTSLKQRFGEILANRNVLALFCYSFFTWFVATSFAGYWAKDYFITMHDYSPESALELMQIFWISYLVGNLVVNLGMRQKAFYVPALRTLALVHCAILLFLSIPVIFSYSLCLVVIIIAGCTMAGNSISFAILNTQISHDSAGTVVAMNNICVVFGGLVGQYIFGTLVSVYDPHSLPWFPAVLKNYYIALLTLPIAAFLALLPLVTLLRRNI